jgi:hypothetical protein
VISAAENSNKFQITGFWNEKSVENVVRLEGLGFKHDFLSYLAIQKIDTYIVKECPHVELPIW